MRKQALSIGDIIEKEENFETFRNKVKEFDVVFQFGLVFPELKQIAQAVKVVKKIL